MSRVRVLHGRWKGRTGRLVGVHTNPGGAAQQSQSYPVVELEPAGRAAARTVRVLAGQPVEPGEPVQQP